MLLRNYVTDSTTLQSKVADYLHFMSPRHRQTNNASKYIGTEIAQQINHNVNHMRNHPPESRILYKFIAGWFHIYNAAFNVPIYRHFVRAKKNIILLPCTQNNNAPGYSLTQSSSQPANASTEIRDQKIKGQTSQHTQSHFVSDERKPPNVHFLGENHISIYENNTNLNTWTALHLFILLSYIYSRCAVYRSPPNAENIGHQNINRKNERRKKSVLFSRFQLRTKKRDEKVPSGYYNGL